MSVAIVIIGILVLIGLFLVACLLVVLMNDEDFEEKR